jgi:hypothetical protein
MTTLPEYKAAMEKLKEEGKGVIVTAALNGTRDENNGLKGSMNVCMAGLNNLLEKSAHFAASFVSGRVVEEGYCAECSKSQVARQALADVKGEGK